MGKYCEICQRGMMVGNNVSHSVRRTSRDFAPNVQKVRVEINGSNKRISVCTRCLRSGFVTRALPRKSAVLEEVTE